MCSAHITDNPPRVQWSEGGDCVNLDTVTVGGDAYTVLERSADGSPRVLSRFDEAARVTVRLRLPEADSHTRDAETALLALLGDLYPHRPEAP